jgi:hypothetical protein
LTKAQVGEIRREHCEYRNCWGLWVADGEPWCCWHNCIGFERAAKQLEDEEETP